MNTNQERGVPGLFVSTIPVVALLVTFAIIIWCKGAEIVNDISYIVLLCASALAVALSRILYHRPWKVILHGIWRSIRQTSPSLIILVFVAMIAASWMLSGIVPTLMVCGLKFLNPQLFLFLTCLICGIISVMTGSSWTTIATIGVAFMGIGELFGYASGWIAGAIISGAYFGDKMSPLSDTTVLASSSCGVDLFTHVKYMTITSGPSMGIALLVFALVGVLNPVTGSANTDALVHMIESTFVIDPWLLVVPVITCIMIVKRVNTNFTLAVSTAMGLVCMFISQDKVLAQLTGTTAPTMHDELMAALTLLFSETHINTGSEMLNSLVDTGGVKGMLPTIFLVTGAMIFGGSMFGTGMLSRITKSVTRFIRTRVQSVVATVCGGLFFNTCMGDQYLSIILGSNMFKSIYQRNGLEPRLLSRAVEDSTSVTSVLIPWNSCGLTQSTVLGVATLTYLPYCIFNYMSPLMTIFIAWVGFKVKQVKAGENSED